jgi:hypothetical protein
MTDGLSEKERKKYQIASEEFRHLKDEIEKMIGHLEEEIQAKRRFLIKMRPKVPGANRECPDCKIISMKYEGVKPSEKQFDIEQPPVYTPMGEYKCLLCGKEYEEPAVRE